MMSPPPVLEGGTASPEIPDGAPDALSPVDPPPPPSPTLEERIRRIGEAAVARAKRIAVSKPTVYKLGAGGRNPKAETPFTVRDGVLGSDCIGFTLWCLGIDRYQPKTFPYYDGWINTDSAIADAKGKKTYFEVVTRPQPGDQIVYPSIRKDGKMTRMGHVGLVVEVPSEWHPDFSFSLPPKERKEWLKKVRVIDCNASSGRKLKKQAVAECAASDIWDKPDAVFIRLKRIP